MPEIIETDVSNVVLFFPCYLNPKYADSTICFPAEGYRHSAWNYFTDVIARCDLQRETVKLIITSDVEQVVRRANVALQ